MVWIIGVCAANVRKKKHRPLKMVIQQFFDTFTRQWKFRKSIPVFMKLLIILKNQ